MALNGIDMEPNFLGLLSRSAGMRPGPSLAMTHFTKHELVLFYAMQVHHGISHDGAIMCPADVGGDNFQGCKAEAG